MTSIKGMAQQSHTFFISRLRLQQKGFLLSSFVFKKMNFSTKEFRLKTRGIKAIFQKSTKLLNMKTLDNGKIQ